MIEFLEYLKKFFNFFNNKNIVYRTKGNKKVFYYFLDNKCIELKGTNNIISLKCKLKNLKGLKIKVKGSNNYIKIEGPVKFKNSTIAITGNNNIFILRKPARNVKNCYFRLCGLSKVFIGKDCGLNMGLYAIINNNYKKSHKLQIGNGVFIGKDVIIRTSDGHAIIDPNTKLAINEPRDVIIGNNVWIGARNVLLKGSYISDGSIIGAQSTVSRQFKTPNVIIAGNPAKIIKTNIIWDVRNYGEYMQEEYNNNQCAKGEWCEIFV